MLGGSAKKDTFGARRFATSFSRRYVPHAETPKAMSSSNTGGAAVLRQNHLRGRGRRRVGVDRDAMTDLKVRARDDAHAIGPTERATRPLPRREGPVRPARPPFAGSPRVQRRRRQILSRCIGQTRLWWPFGRKPPGPDTGSLGTLGLAD